MSLEPLSSANKRVSLAEIAGTIWHARRWLSWFRSLLAPLLVVSFAAVAWASGYYLTHPLPHWGLIPGWLLRTHDHGQGELPLLALLSAIAPWAACWALREARANRIANAALLVMSVSVCVNVAGSLTPPRGIEPWTSRFIQNHGDFLYHANRAERPLSLLREYETRVSGHAMGDFLPSKPPGSVGFYVVLRGLSHQRAVLAAVSPLRAMVARDTRINPLDTDLVALSIAALTLLSALASALTMLVARELHPDHDPGSWAIAGLLLATCPSIALIAMHLDGSLFPLLSVAALGCVARAARGRHLAWAFASGALAVLALYCSYGLLPLLMAVGWVALSVAPRGRWGALSCVVVLGALVTLLALTQGLAWRPIDGYVRSIAWHRAYRADVAPAWKSWATFVEFAWFTGLLWCAIWLAAMASDAHSSARAWLQTRRAHGAVPSLGLGLLTLAAMAAITHRIGTPEVARLWQFMLPWMALSTVGLFRRERTHDLGLALVSFQALSVLWMRGHLM